MVITDFEQPSEPDGPTIDADLLGRIFDHSPAAIVVRDEEGKFLYANERARRHARTDRRLEGATLDEIYPFDRADEIMAIDRDVIRTGVPLLSEGRFMLNDGTINTIVIARHAAQLEHDSTVIVSIGTERTDVHAEPDEAELRFRQLIDNIEDVFILTALDPFRNLYVSPNVRTVFGIEPADMDIEHFLAVVHPDDRDQVAETIVRPAEAHGDNSLEYRILGPDRTERWMRARTRVVSGPAGDPRAVTIVTDITDDRALQEDLARARDAAQSANARKDEFLSHMSHELRTPLHAILGFAQLLELDHDRFDVEHVDALHEIRTAGQHLLDLINEILDRDRIERGNLAIALETVEIGATVSAVAKLLGPLADAQGVSLIERGPRGSSIEAHVDEQRLRQVMLNVVGNAIKYNRPGGSVEIDWQSTDQGTVTIEVADTGVGIPQDRVDRLFTPYDRLGRDDTEGTGLGLALSRQLVEMMHGTVAIESRVGHGTTVHLELPAAARDSQ